MSIFNDFQCKVCETLYQIKTNFTPFCSLSCLIKYNVVVGEPDAHWLWRTKPLKTTNQFSYQGKVYTAARLVYETYVGPIPRGCEVKRICGTSNCINPKHLLPILSKRLMIKDEFVDKILGTK